MGIPKPVLEIAAKNAAKFPNDVDRAIEQTNIQVRKLPDFAEFAGALIHQALTDCVYDARHNTNRRIKNETGQYAKPAKLPATTQEIQDAYESVYSYCMAGKSLGSITGSEFAEIAESEAAIADGHRFNVQLA